MIRVVGDRCTGCQMCEVACSFYHYGEVSRDKSRIKVVHLYDQGIHKPSVCSQCQERYCMDCSASAIATGPGGEIRVSHTVCDMCKMCAKNCPVGAIEYFQDIVHVCDLCGGDPKCVKACTEEAILFEPAVTEAISFEEIKKETKKMGVSQKRTYHVGHYV